MNQNKPSRSETLVQELADIRVLRGAIVQMARSGQIYEIACEMPTCYCFKGRRHFDTRSAPMTDWALNADHYPTLKTDGGTLTPGNIRLAHVLCNREDFSWRTLIRKMLDKGLSLETIAEELNSQSIRSPHGTGTWSAKTVRKAYVS